MPDDICGFCSMVLVQIKADSRYPIDRSKIRLAIEQAVERERVESDLVVSVMVVGDRRMRQLNREFHEVDSTTDVLSFPYLDPLSNPNEPVPFVGAQEEGAQVLGDLVISYPEAVRQAKSKGKLVDEVIDFLVDHGMLHLFGHHHE